MPTTNSNQWLLARPEVSIAETKKLAQDIFGLTDVSIKELGSQQDRNFAVQENTESATAKGAEILLKIDNPVTTNNVRSLQCEAAQALNNAGINTPRERKTVSGKTSSVFVAANGSKYTARAFEFISGASLMESRWGGALAERLGKLTGKTVAALKDFNHQAAARNIQWEMRSAAKVIHDLVHYLPAKQTQICLQASQKALQQLEPIKANLPTQIIHGDITRDNVMLDNFGRLWLIDLGDVASSWRVAELAITCADVLGHTGSLAQVVRTVKGYVANTLLTESEVAALWPLIILRGAVLAVSGWSQVAIDPDNTYAQQRMQHEWQVFERSLNIPLEVAQANLRLAAGFHHLEEHSYSPILANFKNHTKLDFGVESPLLDRGVWLRQNIEAEIAASFETEIQVAPFGEGRLTRVTGDVLNPPPTRARCIEIWCPKHSQIAAPFAGTVKITDKSVSLTDDRITITFSGVTAAITDQSNVAAGEKIAFSDGKSFTVSRQVPGKSQDCLFAQFDGEYETDGALDPSHILGITAVNDPDVRLLEQQSRRDLAMGGASERYYKNPPQIERGWMTLLVETRARAYLDMVNNVTAIGHSHPKLADRVCRQLNLLNTNSRFLYEAYADFTEKLLRHSPHPSLDTVIPVNSGSEALDLAIRLAQVSTGRKDIVAVREGYHGWTMASDAVTTSAYDNPNALQSRPDWVHIVENPNAYRGRFRGKDAGEKYAAEVVTVFQELSKQNKAPAAFLAEPVHGNGGGVFPPPGYLEQVYEGVRSAGGLVIADEVQVGYGRLGAGFWASEILGTVPDIIATAKAAGNAYPLGAVITRREVVESLMKEGMFFSSAGGAPASAVAGATVLDVIESERLQENARVVGAYMLKLLKRLQEKHPLIGTIHGSGLYLGVEMVRDKVTLEPARRETAWICERLLSHGVIMQPTSERQNVLKIKPPMVITKKEVQMFVAALDKVLLELPKSDIF